MEPTLEAPVTPHTDTLGEPVDTMTDESLIEDELLVEEISIDGMCGVY